MKRRNSKSDVTPLSAEVTSMMRNLARDARGVHPEIWARWIEIVGPETYKRAFPRSLKGGTLLVGVVSSAWVQELSFLIPRLLDRIADEVGPDVVKEIKLVLDPAVGSNGRVDPRG